MGTKVILCGLAEWGDHMYHSTRKYENIESIIESNSLRTKVKYHDESISKKTGMVKDNAKNVTIDLSGDLEANIESMSETTKGKFIVEIDKSVLQDTLQDLFEKKLLAADIPDTESLDQYEEFDIVWVTPHTRYITIRPHTSNTHKRLNVKKSGYRKGIKFSEDEWDKVYSELTPYLDDSKLNKGKYTVSIHSGNISRELYRKLRYRKGVWESQESIVLGPNAARGGEEYSYAEQVPDKEYENLMNTVHVWNIPIKITRIFVLQDQWEELDDSQRKYLESKNAIPIERDNISKVLSSIQASKIAFSPKNVFGLKYYVSKHPDAIVDYHNKYSVIVDDDDGKYYLRIWENDQWKYPTWSQLSNGFNRLEDVSHWLSQYDWKNANAYVIKEDNSYTESHYNDFLDAMQLLGFSKLENEYFGKDDKVYELRTKIPPDPKLEFMGPRDMTVRVIYFEDEISVDYWVDYKRLNSQQRPPDTSDISKMVKNIEKMLSKYGAEEVVKCGWLNPKYAKSIVAKINPKNIADRLVKVNSSNIWAYCIDIKQDGDKTGNVLTQFKSNTGGPGDIYIYYDVPVNLYTKWVRTTSKGHFFWRYIRNQFKYSKLTGNKRGILPNAVN